MTKKLRFYIQLQGDGMPNITTEKPNCENSDFEELVNVAEFYEQIGQYLQQKKIKLWHE